MTKKEKILTIFIFVLISINYISIYLSYSKLNNRVNSLKELVNKNESVISQKNAEINNKINSIKDMEKSIFNIKKSYDFLQASYKASEGLVTDQFYVQKARFSELESDIDVRLQPSFTRYYKGQGKFNLSDRELKSMILEIMQEVDVFWKKELTMYSNYYHYFRITTHNYEVGNYQDGVVKLRGE
jgi:hypothetical protein